MSIEAWAHLWGAVLLLSLLAFSVVAVAVTVGGFFDIRTMLRRIDTHHEQQKHLAEQKQPPEEPS